MIIKHGSFREFLPEGGKERERSWLKSDVGFHIDN